MTDALGAWFAPGKCTKRTPAKTVIIEIIIITIMIMMSWIIETRMITITYDRRVTTLNNFIPKC